MSFQLPCTNSLYFSKQCGDFVHMSWENLQPSYVKWVISFNVAHCQNLSLFATNSWLIHIKCTYMMAVGYTCIRRFISFLTTYGALPDTYNNNDNRPLKRHRVYANVICLPECVYTCVFYSVNVCMEQLCCSVLQCSSVFLRHRVFWSSFLP